MVQKLTCFLSGWKHGTADDYNLCYNLYGGSFMTHPDVLSFLENRLDFRSTYFVKRDKNEKLLGDSAHGINAILPQRIRMLKELALISIHLIRMKSYYLYVLI